MSGCIGSASNPATVGPVAATLPAPTRAFGGFVESIETERARVGWTRFAVVLGYAFAYVGCVILLVSIPSGRPIWNSVYAEDGAIFLRDGLTRSWPGVIFRQYAGYMHLVPRLISGVAVLAPLRDAPIVFTLASALVRAGIAVFIFRASAGHLRAPAFRLLAAAVVITVPSGETLDNIANLHWYLIAGAFWAVLWRPRSRLGVAVAASVVVAAVCSDPLTLTLTPLVLLRIATLRSWRDQVVSIAFGCAAVVQLLVVSQGTRVDRRSYDWGQIPSIAAVRVVVPFVTGRDIAGDLVGGSAQNVLLAGAVVVLLLIAWPGLRAGGASRAVVLAAMFVGAALMAVAWRKSGGGIPDPATTLRGDSRYVVTPTILLAGALAASLSAIGHRMTVRHTVFSGAITALVVGVMLFGQTPTKPQPGANWHPELARARAACASTGASSEVLHIRPGTWHVKLPCTVLRPGHPVVGGAWVGTGGAVFGSVHVD